MPALLTDDDFLQLQESLPPVFRHTFINERAILEKAFPLLEMLCKHREVIARLSQYLEIQTPPSNQALLLSQALPQLEGQFNSQASFQYRLPVILSEFPIHSRAINQCIKAFNNCIEAYHQGIGIFLDGTSVADCYEDILQAINKHGAYCDSESLAQLLRMLGGWSYVSPQDLFQSDDTILQEQAAPILREFDDNPVIIPEIEQPLKSSSQNPFTPDYNYNLDGAGRLAKATKFVLANAFGTKIAGHTDAQVKYPPQFIPVELLHTLIRRQLSHRMDVWPTPLFNLWMAHTLHKSGVAFIAQGTDYSRDVWVNPLLTQPLSFLSPEKIHANLKETLVEFKRDELNPSESELNILSQYLFELLQGFQTNPGQALGIGANWDGTISLSNEAGTYAFKFRENEEAWGRRFKQLSLHRQGPSEARMNATIGIKYEINALLTNFEYMTQLQPSEQPEVLYNALIDNLVAELLPDPPYFENEGYQKHRKNYVARRDDAGSLLIDSFLEPSSQGTYFVDKKGQEKQTPMYRRAGTMDVQAFPKNTTCSEQLRVCYEGNPLGPLQLQYAQSMQKSTRGHIVYDPIAPDKFLEDDFYGQVIRSDNDDYLPYIGVIPKNFDRHFNQENELCASFVIRMLQSARIREYSPTFIKTLEAIKTRFLPPKNTELPTLPPFCTDYLFKKQEQLNKELQRQDRTFTDCEAQFYSLFKNLIYSLYDAGRQDEQFQHGYLSYINDVDTFNLGSKAHCEKLIRDLTVNKPIGVSPESLRRYEGTLNYLREITAYFYPTPSDVLAEEIAKQARLHVAPLLQSRSIGEYFAKQRQNLQENLSRKQSPGMLYALLKHDGRPSQTVWKEYLVDMHRNKSLSFYRDPDGTPIGEPQTVDKFLDGGAKFVGAFIQLLHRYNLFALLHNPVSETFMHAKENAAEHRHDSFKPLWALLGGVEGFVWHGLLKGLWQTTSAPFIMASDFFKWQWEGLETEAVERDNNPLAIPAAPANDASVKTLASAHSRDFLLQLLKKGEREHIKKNTVIIYTTELAKRLYPSLTDENLKLYRIHLENNFPLDENKWANMFTPLLLSDDDEFAAIVKQFNAYINKSLIQAVFRCLTHPSFLTNGPAIIKETESFFQLNSKQKEGLKAFLTYSNQVSIEERLSLLNLFQYEGEIHQALQRRDHSLQKIQRFILSVFDEVAIHNLITLESDNCDESAPLVCRNADKNLSVKDKAHIKWAEFTERELKHQLLSLPAARDVLTLLTNKVEDPNLIALINQLEILYESLSVDNDNALLSFYETASIIQEKLTLFLQKNKFNNPYTDAQALLANFINVTMNAIINARLDAIDIFSDETPLNPLYTARPIEIWLLTLQQNNRDLRSLFEQQVQQSPSLDHAIWRSKCILEVMEKAAPDQKIPKTGMQSLLRFRSQHRDNVTRTAEIYFDSRDLEMKKADFSTLFANSVTMEHALSRVQEKLPPAMSFFGGYRKIEGLKGNPIINSSEEFHL
ncbi:MAG: hypothetical protein Q8M03_13370 [Legionella sp.]|nr:hypothetical protein [Legionella sp.]